MFWTGIAAIASLIILFFTRGLEFEVFVVDGLKANVANVLIFTIVFAAIIIGAAFLTDELIKKLKDNGMN